MSVYIILTMYAIKDVLYIRKHTASCCQDDFVILNKKQNIYLLAYASKKIFIFLTVTSFLIIYFLLYTILYNI